jgi:ribosomal protein S18 acetylase RimI-like enzyme
MTLVFQAGGLSVKDLYGFLSKCNSQFSPHLSSRVDLLKYAEKLVHNAVIMYAKENKKLIGLIAFYANNFKLDFAFISLFCVLEGNKGNGIATRLMNECILNVKNSGFRFIKLEVYSDNRNAISFYSKFGFNVEEQNKPSFIMLKRLY